MRSNTPYTIRQLPLVKRVLHSSYSTGPTYLFKIECGDRTYTERSHVAKSMLGRRKCLQLTAVTMT